MLGALLLVALLPDALTDAVNLGVPALGEGVGAGAGFVIEAILTFFLVWVIFATAADPRGSFKSIAGLAIGLTITLDILIGGPLTGAAMNPGRAFGPQLIGNEWGDGWVWYLGPLPVRAYAVCILILAAGGDEPGNMPPWLTIPQRRISGGRRRSSRLSSSPLVCSRLGACICLPRLPMGQAASTTRWVWSGPPLPCARWSR